jgi:biotin transport system substrate-specific component
MIKKKTMTIQNLALYGLFAALIAVGAFIKIPFPGIPFTLQILFVILAGLLLGSKGGLISVLVYIFIGLTGVPVFTGGGGIGYVLQPTFGYIIGFAIGAFVIGWITERKVNPSIKYLIFAGIIGSVVIYTIGLTWYYVIANYYLQTAVGAKTLMISGFLMLLPGDIVKISLSAFLAKRLAPFVNQSESLKI